MDGGGGARYSELRFYSHTTYRQCDLFSRSQSVSAR